MGHRHVVRLSVCSALAAAISSYLLLNVSHLWYDGYLMPAILFTGAGIFFGLMSAVCLDMVRLRPADSHTMVTLCAQYFAMRMILVLGILAWWPMYSYYKDCRKAQDNILRHILDQNKDTAYGRDYQLASMKTRDQFIAQHPITTYSQFEKYAERVANGEKNVMTKADVIYLGLTSGTTGKSKVLPLTEANVMELYKVAMHTRLRLHGYYKNAGLKRNFLFQIWHPQKRSEGGILMGGIGLLRDLDPIERNITPKEFLSIHEEAPSFYVQAIFALSECEIGRIDGFSSDLMYAFFNFMVLHKEEICKSLEMGVIGKFPGLDENIRWKMCDRLEPNAVRAEKVRAELSGNKVGLALRLWPELALCVCAKSGGFANSANLLARTYLKNVPMGFGLHVATEGVIDVELLTASHLCHDGYLIPAILLTGTSMDVKDLDEYTLVPNRQFMEFIPIEDMDEDQPKTIFMDELQVGKQYEVVVTNINGLYRNRFGDVIEVTGFHHSTPKYKISHRTGQILNLNFEKLTEKVLYNTIQKMSETWQGLTVIHYTSTESFYLEEISGEVVDPACYVIFLEIASDEQEDVRLTQMHADNFDEALCRMHEIYKAFRNQKSIGAPQLIQVRPGCFDAVRAAMFGDRISLQFKMPRVQRNPAILQILWDHRLI